MARGSAPAPPVVTITNPAAPGPLRDVAPLEPPRRLTPEQRRWAWLTAAILGLVSVAVHSAGALRDGHRRDRQALAEVMVAPVSDVEHPGALTLLNQGRHAVSVLSVRLGVDGYPVLSARPNSLAPGSPDVVVFTVPSTCPRVTVVRPDAAVELRVRTYRGGTTTVRLPDQSDNGFVATALAQCGRFPPAFSLELQGVTASRAGRDLEVGLILTNRAPDVRTLQSFTANGGLLVVRDSPTRFVGRSSAIASLVLRVTDCGAALGTWALVPQQQGFTPTYRAPTGGGSLDAQVDGETAVGLLTAGADSIRTWVLQTCGS
jgi:hypothetical protein